MKIKLGSKYRDTVTGFSGVAVARTEWLHGCERITLQPTDLDKDGKIRETATFDVPQLELVEEKKVDRKTDTGGPRPDAPRGR